MHFIHTFENPFGLSVSSSNLWQTGHPNNFRTDPSLRMTGSHLSLAFSLKEWVSKSPSLCSTWWGLVPWNKLFLLSTGVLPLWKWLQTNGIVIIIIIVVIIIDVSHPISQICRRACVILPQLHFFPLFTSSDGTWCYSNRIQGLFMRLKAIFVTSLQLWLSGSFDTAGCLKSKKIMFKQNSFTYIEQLACTAPWKLCLTENWWEYVACVVNTSWSSLNNVYMYCTQR